MPKRPRLSVPISSSVLARLEARAQAEDRTVSQMAGRLVVRGVNLPVDTTLMEGPTVRISVPVARDTRHVLEGIARRRGRSVASVAQWALLAGLDPQDSAPAQLLNTGIT